MKGDICKFKLLAGILFFFIFQQFVESVENNTLSKRELQNSCDENCFSCRNNRCRACNLGYFLNTNRGCQKCDIENCQSCSSSGRCEICKNGYSVSYGLCEKVDCSKLSNCLTCSSINLCTQCDPGFYLNFIDSCSACIEGCSSCNILGSCRSCFDGYKLSNKKCIKDESCKSNITGCANCPDNTRCEKCYDGYYKTTSSSCMECFDSNCKRCDTNGICTLCKDGLFLSRNSTCETCAQKNLNCETCISSGLCSRCSTGNYLNYNSTCSKCVENCSSCTDNDTCTECISDKFKLYQGQCLGPCTSQDPTCIDCIGDNICLACQDGYYLSQTRCSACLDKNCKLCNNYGKCNTCNSDYEVHVQGPSNICVPKNTDCKIFNSDLTCVICNDNFFLNSTSNLCQACQIDEYSTGKSCVNCKRTYKACNECDANSCRICIPFASLMKDGNCVCSDSYAFLFSTCVQVTIIYGPLITLVIVIFIFVIVCIFKKRRQLEHRRYQNNLDAERHGNNNHNLRMNIHQNQNRHSELRELVTDTIHFNKCVFGDTGEPFWKLNCGGFMCDNCSMTILSSIGNNGTLKCPKCEKKIEYFNFVNRYRMNPSEDINNSIQKTIAMCDNISLAEEKKCNICFYLPAEKTIKCESTVPHMLCTYCYKRLILIQKIKLCPFCRTSISNNKL